MAAERPDTGRPLRARHQGRQRGLPQEVQRPAMEADIVANDLGPDNIQKKHVANIKWTPGKATVGIGMGKGMYDWIKRRSTRATQPKSGSLHVGRLQLQGAVAPRLPGRAHHERDRARSSTVRARTRRTSTSSSRRSRSAGRGWRRGHPRQGRPEAEGVAVLELPRRDRRSAVHPRRVGRLVHVEVRGRVGPIGIFREPTKHPAKVTVPDLKLVDLAWPTTSRGRTRRRSGSSTASTSRRRRDDGRIVFLDPNMKDEIGEITLMNVGFKKFSKDDFEANSEKIARFSFELYVEKMEFKIKDRDAVRPSELAFRLVVPSARS